MTKALFVVKRRLVRQTGMSSTPYVRGRASTPPPQDANDYETAEALGQCVPASSCAGADGHQ